MKDFSLSTQTEPSIPQAQVSHPRIIEPATDAQQVEPIQKPTGGGTEVIVKPATPTKSTRLFFVDHLRAFLIILVIMHHLAIAYGASGSFYYHDTSNALTTLVLTVFVTIDQAFFMGLFFLISAYFTPGAYDRKGAGLYLRDRFLRMGIPLLIYDLLIAPFVLYIAAGFPGSYWNYYTTYLLSLRSIGDGPVWFIELLLIFVVFYALWRICSTWWSHVHPQKTTPMRPPGESLELSFGQCLRDLHCSPDHSGQSRVWLALRHALPVAQIWSRSSHRRPMLFRAGRSCAHDPLREADFLKAQHMHVI